MNAAARQLRRPPRPRRSRRRRPGYVLLMVLLLLALGGVALATACRRSVRRTLDAARAQDDLQRRWGALSCRRTFLYPADEIVAAAQPGGGGEPVTAVTASFPLGRFEFDVVIGDEQAKANLNALYARTGRDRAARAAKDILTASGATGGNAIRFPRAGRDAGPAKPARLPGRAADAGPSADRPAAEEDADGAGVPPVAGSFGELFPGMSASDLFPITSGRSPATAVTLWGDGRLNFRRASRAALAGVTTPILSPAQVDRLVQLRATSPDLDLDRALTLSGASQADRARLAALLRDQSWCHSLWVAARASGRDFYQLSVRQAIDDDRDLTFTFEW